MTGKHGTVEERFWRYVEKSEGCWHWTGKKTKEGRGRLNINRHAELAHRISYRLHLGDIPNGLVVCHHCDVPQCVNPAHLFLGTQYENMQDMTRKGRASVTRGEKCGKAKITEAQALDIIHSKERAKDLAAKHGISFHTVNHIRIGKRWAHLPRPDRSVPGPA